MSIPFNVAYKGLVQKYEREIGATRGDVANNTARLEELTADMNEAFDEYVRLAVKSCGRWKWDDANHDDYPTITTDIVAGQRSYTFTTDQENNVILDIYKVYTREAADRPFIVSEPIDADFTGNADGVVDGLNVQGVPFQHDKVANAVLLNPVPLASVTDGLKVSINREPSYFTASDTVKKAGIHGTHHKFLYLRPALDYARRNGLDSFVAIRDEYLNIVKEIEEGIAERGREDELVLTTPTINSI